MASYTNRGTKHKPSWQYTISRYVNGKYEPIRKGGFRSKGEAQTEAEEIERRLKHGETLFLEAIPFEEYFEKWYELYKTHVSEATLIHYRLSHRYIKEFFNDKPIQKITRNDYKKFLNEFGEKYSLETMKKVNRHVREVVENAIEEGIIRIDFTRKLVVTGSAGKNKREKHLNFEDSEKLYTELFNHLNNGLSYYAILLLLVSGIRFEELVGLTRNDFDFENNTININKIWGYKKDMPEGFSDTKTPKAERVIGIDPAVMVEFEKLFEKTPNNIHRLVFFSPSSSKYKVISNNAVNKTLKKILKDLDIKPIITPHELRHTHASSLIYKRVDITSISERLGHASPETTYRYYSHVMKELREEDEKIAMNLYANV